MKYLASEGREFYFVTLTLQNCVTDDARVLRDFMRRCNRMWADGIRTKHKFRSLGISGVIKKECTYHVVKKDLFYLCTYEILMWLSFGIRPAKNEHKRLLILKIQSPLVTAFGLSFFLSPKVGNSFQTAKHHSKNLHITSQKAFTTKLSSLSSMGARPHSPGCAILTQIHY
jgi:hypothetical protein